VVLSGWSRHDEEERTHREHDKLLAAILRAGLECAGLDANESPCLRHLENPDLLPEFPRPRQFVHPLRRLAERERPRSLLEWLDELTRRSQKGPAPDLRNASVMQLIGYYCFGDGCAREDIAEALARSTIVIARSNATKQSPSALAPDGGRLPRRPAGSSQ
jgi:hypothetical protein